MNKLLLASIPYIFALAHLAAQCPLDEAVDFATVDIQGDSVQLFRILEQENKYVLIDFYYADCEPCQNVASFLQQAYEYFGCGDFDVDFLSISNRDTDSVSQQFHQTYGINFRTISGVEGHGNQITDLYGIQAFPTIILIAPDHSIVESDIYPIPNASYIINPLEDYNIAMNECIDYQVQASFTVVNDTICSNQSIQFMNSSIGLIDSVLWNFEGGKPQTSTLRNPVIFYDTVGEFRVSLIVNNRFYSDTISIDDFIDVKDCSGFQEFSKNEFNVYPNPGNGNFDVILPGEGTYTISVYDITGQMVHTATLSNTQTDLGITSLKSGVYIISAKNGVQEYKERVIIK